MRTAVNNGQSPVTVRVSKSSLPSTPSKRAKKTTAAFASPGTPGTGAGSGRASSSAKRKTPRPNYREDINDDSSGEVDYDQLDLSPSLHLTKKVKTIPSLHDFPPIKPLEAPAPSSQSMPLLTGGQPSTVPAATAPAAHPPPSFVQTPSDSDFSMVQTPSYQQHHHIDFDEDPAMSFLESSNELHDNSEAVDQFMCEFSLLDNGEI
jgi:hypothetical protein